MYKIKTFAGIDLPKFAFMDLYDAAAGHRPTFTDHRLVSHDGIEFVRNSTELDFFNSPRSQVAPRLQRRQLTVTGSILNSAVGLTKDNFVALRQQIGYTGPLVRQLTSAAFFTTISSTWNFLKIGNVPQSEQITAQADTALSIHEVSSGGAVDLSPVGPGAIITIVNQANANERGQYRVVSVTPQTNYVDYGVVVLEDTLNGLGEVCDVTIEPGAEATDQTVRARLTNIQGGYEPFNDRFVRDFSLTFDLLDPVWNGTKHSASFTVGGSTAVTFVNNGDAWVNMVTAEILANNTQGGLNTFAASGKLDRLTFNFTVGFTQLTTDPNEQIYIFDTRTRRTRRLRTNSPDYGDDVVTTLTFDASHTSNDIILVPPRSSIEFNVGASTPGGSVWVFRWYDGWY